jgi:hypothetical protein
MKKYLPFLLSLCILVSGCSNSKAIPTAIAASTEIPVTHPASSTNLVESAKETQIIPQEYLSELGKYPNLISLGGKKIALKFPVMEVNKRSSFVLPVLSTNEKMAVNNLEIQLDRAATLYYFDSWSPDSTAFAGIYYDAKKFNGAETCCGEAIAITSIDSGKAQTFTYSWGWNEAAIVSWSTDGSKVSVTFVLEHNTLIIDRHGNLLQTLNAGEKAFFWYGDLLYYTVRKEDKEELHAINLNTQESQLLLSDLGNLYYVAHNKDSSEIFLTERVRKQSNTDLPISKFYIFNIEGKSIENIETPNRKEVLVFPWASSPMQDYVAMVGYDGSLWILNWSTHKLKEYGQIKNLLGWYTNIGGFLVTTLDGKQKIIIP